jgi:glycosyltransferase involved in cell wall biosynthesis
MTQTIKIEVHSLLHQEAQLIPYFIRHYQQFADIIFYESDSTDGSPDIAKRLGAKVLPLNTGNEVNELSFLQMKNNCWKDSKADWVIICDTDEFIYHPNLVEILQTTEYNAFYPKEWRMYSRYFPTTAGQIYDEVRYGIPGQLGYNKLNIFRPSEIKEMNYDAGCHSCHPIGNIKLAPETNIVMLHFHNLGIDWRIAKNKYIASRVSEENKKRGWGTHVFLDEKKVREDIETAMKQIVKVL